MTPPPAPHFDETLRDPLRRALAARPGRRLPAESKVPAAVLMPIFVRDGEAHVWLVRRPDTMRSHAGQVAFPGGKADPGDESLRATALREAEEELGIPPASVEVLGSLDDLMTLGFVVTPWVGWIAEDLALRPNPGEVARVFAPELREFFAPPQGVVPFGGWMVEDELVWGATAAMLRAFVSLVREF
jgi:8-oxo-dGTP pyrophosphatase MutT (NUDIX family)